MKIKEKFLENTGENLRKIKSCLEMGIWISTGKNLKFDEIVLTKSPEGDLQLFTSTMMDIDYPSEMKLFHKEFKKLFTDTFNVDVSLVVKKLYKGELKSHSEIWRGDVIFGTFIS